MPDEAFPACPACSAETHPKPRGRIARCAACGHSWIRTSRDEQASSDKAIYTRSYAGYRDDPTLAQNFDRIIADVLLPRIPAAAAIIDVGCGAGAFLSAAKRAGLSATGLDVSEDAAVLCQQRGHEARAGDFLQTDGLQAVDVITMWDVLEHLRDPASFLKAAAVRLRPGGTFFAKVPTYGSVSIAIADRIPRLRQVLLGAPDHVQYFTPRSLRALFDGSELTVVELSELPGGIRTPPTGGGLRKRLGRRVKQLIASTSGEGNVLIVAKSAPSKTGCLTDS
ncbi:methyltransferase domain-containing protein [Parafrankia sp. BMG5.11]|uniref:methyltransferase domain-containing protein n=1 Tax=Parafrankia sp. BMG5.11 TaxID=222540 RepID=UPI001FB28C77|nr:methyltransferase domain-containing protein [Parafrankia sp. BMG5.11]